MHPFTVSISEAAEALGLVRTTIYALINDGQLDTIKVGRRRLVKLESIHRLLEASS